MKKAVIISGNLAQDHEFIYPYYRLLEADYDVDVCLLEGKPVKGILGTTLPPNKNQIIKTINEIKVSDYEILVLPGGVKAMEKVRQEKKMIACICSAAQLLISAKVVKGRKIAGYYSMKDDLINAGAIYTDKPAVVDDNIITTAHYKDMGSWMREIIKKVES